MKPRIDLSAFFPSVLWVSLLLTSSGCGPLLGASKNSVEHFVIEEAIPTSATPSEQPLNAGLLVREAQGNRLINSNKIVFSDGNSRRGYYQLARWVEPPTRRFSVLLLNRLEHSRLFSSVSRLGNATIGDFQLNAELNDFYHDIKSTPGSAVAEITVELVDLKTRQMVARKRFSQEVSAESFDGEGAVRALTLAMNQILDQIVIWLESEILKLRVDQK